MLVFFDFGALVTEIVADGGATGLLVFFGAFVDFGAFVVTDAVADGGAVGLRVFFDFGALVVTEIVADGGAVGLLVFFDFGALVPDAAAFVFFVAALTSVGYCNANNKKVINKSTFIFDAMIQYELVYFLWGKSRLRLEKVNECAF